MIKFASGGHEPRRAIEAADLVVDSMMATRKLNDRRVRSGEGLARWRWRRESRNGDVVEGKVLPRHNAIS